jgi:hypothetical protein
MSQLHLGHLYQLGLRPQASAMSWLLLVESELNRSFINIKVDEIHFILHYATKLFALF